MKIFKHCLVTVFTLIACIGYISLINSYVATFNRDDITVGKGTVMEYNYLPSSKIIKVNYQGKSQNFVVDAGYNLQSELRGSDIDVYTYNNHFALSENMLISEEKHAPLLLSGVILIVSLGVFLGFWWDGALKNE